MTSSEKRNETRKRHDEAQRAKDREKIEIRAKMKSSCLSILDDPTLTAKERFEVLKILHDLTEGR